MKRPLALLFFGVVLCAGLAVAAYYYLFRPMTTVILVRHAEKKIEPSNPNPELSPAGEARAQELARILGDAGVNAIFVTQYIRTQRTAKPLADKLGLQVNQVESSNSTEVARRIKKDYVGQVVFVAGHNNTVPAIIAALGGGSYPTIPESEYDNMFVVTIYRLGKAKVVRLRYGNAMPAEGNQQMMVQP